MVKLGFIVEGDTEKILLESHSFKNLLHSLKVDYVSDIINVGGNNHLLPTNIEKHSKILIDKGATNIIVLTDLDNDACVTETKNRIKPLENHSCIISKKKIESWFLADTVTLRNFIESNISEHEDPESIDNPFEEIRRIKIELTSRGFVKSKRYLARSMVSKGFSFERAASHSNCTSAKYFIDKLKTLSNQN